MTPMIDVVFLLLVFFVWTSSFETPEFDLPSSLAELPEGGRDTGASTQPTEVFDELVVRMRLQDALTVMELNGQVYSEVDELKSRLASILSIGVQPPIIIDPSEQVTMGAAVQVYDAARDAGADRVLFTARPE